MPLPLPFAPRRIVIGATAHAAITAFVRERRPELEVRGAKFTDVTVADLAWGETYIGFKRPPAAATMGAIRWVHCTGAGVDSWVAQPELDRNILLTRTPESFGPAIAEWAVSRILAFQQELLDVHRAQTEHRWAHREVKVARGTRALVVGTGDVGSAVASQLAALGIRVTGLSRTGVARSGNTGSTVRQLSPFESIHTVDRLAELVGGADWIILTLPITPATRGLFSRDILSRCRNAVLLNAGRGAVVEEAALPEALDNGWLRGAALDVFDVEPLPEASPLWSDPRVMVSPHISGPTTTNGAGEGFLQCLAELEAGRLPKWAIDRERGY